MRLDNYAFEMKQGGSKNALKGLPLPSQQIQFTVFVSLKAGKKAGLEHAPADIKWLIPGELALDAPVSECPGEIGVVAFQITDIPNKSDVETESKWSTESVENAESHPGTEEYGSIRSGRYGFCEAL